MASFPFTNMLNRQLGKREEWFLPSNRRVLASGVWDLFHVGHVRILERARAFGDYLIVAVNTDRKAGFYKRKPVFPEDQRLEIVRSLRYVDEAFLLDAMDLKPSILKYKVNIVVHGNDCSRERYLTQTHMSEEWLKQNRITLILVPYTPGISTTENFKSNADEYKRLLEEENLSPREQNTNKESQEEFWQTKSF